MRGNGASDEVSGGRFIYYPYGATGPHNTVILLIGPCMFLAPLMILLIPVAIVLWPPALILTGVAWLLLWPVVAVVRGSGDSVLARIHAVLGRWFRTLLTPWTYFDVPDESVPDDETGDDTSPPPRR